MHWTISPTTSSMRPGLRMQTWSGFATPSLLRHASWSNLRSRRRTMPSFPSHLGSRSRQTAANRRCTRAAWPVWQGTRSRPNAEHMTSGSEEDAIGCRESRPCALPEQDRYLVA